LVLNLPDYVLATYPTQSCMFSTVMLIMNMRCSKRVEDVKY
jgi:hypothetical protein